MQLSRLIKQLRKNAGLTQKKAAELMRVNERTWQKWELDERKITLNIIELFCMKTNQNFNELIKKGESEMVTASNSIELFERVEEFLGSSASETNVKNAIEILYKNGYTLGQYSTDENKWAKMDNILDFWPENMLDLI